MSNTFTHHVSLTLFDDESVHKKLTVMDKVDAMMDDERNWSDDYIEDNEAIEKFLQFGKSYKITITYEELP